jgi:hypothetical protein
MREMKIANCKVKNAKRKLQSVKCKVKNGVILRPTPASCFLLPAPRAQHPALSTEHKEFQQL